MLQLFKHSVKNHTAYNATCFRALLSPPEQSPPVTTVTLAKSINEAKRAFLNEVRSIYKSGPGEVSPMLIQQLCSHGVWNHFRPLCTNADSAVGPAYLE